MVEGWTVRIKSEDKVRALVVKTKPNVSTGKGEGSALHSQSEITRTRPPDMGKLAVRIKI